MDILTSRSVELRLIYLGGRVNISKIKVFIKLENGCIVLLNRSGN